MQSPNRQPEEEFLQSQAQISLAESLGKQTRLGFVAFCIGVPPGSLRRPSLSLFSSLPGRQLAAANDVLRAELGALERLSQKYPKDPHPTLHVMPSVCSAPNGSACSLCSVCSCLLLG